MSQGPYGQPPPGQPGYGPPQGQPPYGAPPGYAPPPGYGAPQVGYAGAPGAPQIAGMGDRLLARLIDWALITVFVVIALTPGLVMLISESDREADPSAGAVFLFLAGLGIVIPAVLLYEPVLITKRGATVGKKAMKLTVRMEATGAFPSAKTSLLRWIIPVAASLAPLGSVLVYLSPLFDNSGRRQGWHDKVAKTVVVKNAG